MEDQSIKVSIAGRVYPLTVKNEEEEYIRKAVKKIDLMVREYEKKYAVKDKQDLLAMCALEYSTDKIKLEHDDSQMENQVTDQMKRMEEKIKSIL